MESIRGEIQTTAAEILGSTLVETHTSILENYFKENLKKIEFWEE